MIAIGGALVYTGLPLFAFSAALGLNQADNRYFPWAVGVGFAMVVAGGILMGELRL